MKLFTGLFAVVCFIVIEPIVSRVVRQANTTSGQSFCAEGDVIVQQNIFKYKCINGFPKLISCIGTVRANNVEIKVNETKTVDGFWYKCSEDNGRPHYAEEPRCLIGEKAVHTNETVTIGSLVFLCNTDGVQVTGCVFTDQNGKEIRTKVGESAQIGSVRHICGGLSGPNGTRTASGGSTSQGSGTSQPAEDIPCTNDGKEYKNKETWKAKSFRYSCDNGDIKIVSCIIDENNELPVGETTVKFGLLHRCSREGNRISYRSEICGFGNVNCDAAAQNSNKGASSSSNQQQPHSSTGSASPASQSANGTDAGCVKDGQTHAAGSSWTANNFKYSCHNDGSIGIEACVTDSGKEIGIGEVWVLGGLQHVCSPRRNGAVYSSQLCGAQVQCGPEGLQQKPDQSLPRVG